MKQVLVLGATGDVGNGATGALLQAGHDVIAVSRGGAKTAALASRYGGQRLRIVQGTVDDETSAAALLAAIRERTKTVDAVVSSINVQPHRPEALLEWDSAALLETFQHNLMTHFVAAKTLIPLIADGGIYIGIGGGMADRIFPHYGYNSMIQAALRMMFRYIQAETKDRRVFVRELIISAMVVTAEKHNTGDRKFNWIADSEVGLHIKAMIENPASFLEPIHELSSPRQVGKPQPQAVRSSERPA
jgi:NAD(P)-dependent dehydrogenase (short-subunit alcohol dehydrogenase family)